MKEPRDTTWDSWEDPVNPEEVKKVTTIKPYVDDSDWENANLSQGKRSDINHQYSTHPHSLHQRRRRARRR